MVATSLILASEVIGFISFFLTLLTWIGVYISLLTSLRLAPRTIPITLGNLRQELLSERSLMKYRMKRGDQYHVFPGRETHKVGNQQSHTRLALETLKVLWRQFKRIERKFVIKENGDVETASSEDGANGTSENGWVDEKGVGSRSKRARHLSRRNSYIRSRMGVTEAGLSVDRKTYYNTDLWHRVLWWWEQSDVTTLYDRVEKLQIRRMEYDMWETDELVKRTLRIVGGMSGDDIWYSDDRGPKRGGPRGSGKNGGGGGGNGAGGVRGSISSVGSGRSSGGYRRRNSQKRTDSTNMKMRSRNSSAVRGGVRSVYEKETIRVKEQDQSVDSTPTQIQPSVTASRRRTSRAGVPSVVEYEVVQPGRIWVETVDDRDNAGRGSIYDDRTYQDRSSSYRRERSSSRGRR